MARITVEELYNGERNGQKYGGILNAVMKEFMAHGTLEDYDERTRLELLIVKHTLIVAEKMKTEGDFASGLTDTEPLSYSVEVGDGNS